VATLAGDGLRCGLPGKFDPNKPCRKLLAKQSLRGVIEGVFKCTRCGQIVEINAILE
jgi:hypothetical protein